MDKTFTIGARVRYIHDGRDIFGNITTHPETGELHDGDIWYVRAANGSIRAINVEISHLRNAR